MHNNVNVLRAAELDTENGRSGDFRVRYNHHDGRRSQKRCLHSHLDLNPHGDSEV